MVTNLREIISAARAQGWDVRRTQSGHWRFEPPDPEAPIVHTSGTPSDWRAVHNLLAALRRAGLQ